MPASTFTDLNELAGLLKQINIKKPFLVTGAGFYEKCGAKKYIDSIASEFEFHIFCDFSDNPKIEDTKKGIDKLQFANSDCIIAIGGGSVIDMAKSINGLAGSDDVEESITGNRIHYPLLPLIAVPTTAGSGSEATHFAVIYIDGKKYSLAHKDLIPGYAILDVNLLKSQPQYQMAVSGIDAFSQAVESMWSVNSTEESRQYSIEAVKLIWKYLPLLLQEKDDQNLNSVMKGAHLAGMAINISKTTGPHALAYGFTTYHHLPHGHSVALSLPFFINLHMAVNKINCIDKRGESWVLNILEQVAECIGEPFSNLPSCISDFIKSCGLELNFSRLNISRESFERVIKEANVERMSSNPVAVSEDVLSGLYSYNLKLENE
jgi:alcohol dehydrogenase